MGKGYERSYSEAKLRRVISDSNATPAAGSGDPQDLTCEICGARMVERSCKIQCPNCGFTRDCSDP